VSKSGFIFNEEEGNRIRIAYYKPAEATTIPTVFSYLYNWVVEEIHR